MMPISTALQYFQKRNFKIPPEFSSSLLEALKAGRIHSRAFKAATDYQPIRDAFWSAVYEAVSGFLSGNAQVGTFSRPLSSDLAQAYIETADIAYVEGGGSLPLDEDTAAWVKGEMDAQFGYIDSMFQTLKALRKSGDFDAIGEAFQAATRWASALDGLYNAVKLAGAGNAMLTWNLGGTEKHCPDCLKLDGQRHRAAWYSSHGYFPRRPGSNTECGGWNCDCYLTDDNGQEFTI